MYSDVTTMSYQPQMTTGHKLRLPRLQQMHLRHFTLFQNRREISANLDTGVFCLVGANGLGKSTFLAALNFGMTGIVANPQRKFESVEEYYTDSVSYSANYFRGRIAQTDHPVAEVEITFTVATHTYEITRGMFDPLALRALRILGPDNDVLVAGEDLPTDSARQSAYAENLVRDVRVSSFEQFVFTQLLVCTFDERRHLIFWDSPILEQALYLAFGLDPERAQQADTFRRNAAKFESQARNLQYQATIARRRLEGLNQQTAAIPDIDADVLARFEELTRNRDEGSNDVDRLRGILIESNLRLASIRADIAATRTEYEVVFQERLGAMTDPRANVLIGGSIASGRCELCGTQSDSVPTAIRNELDEGRCPLCRSPLAHPSLEPEDATALLQLDQRLESLLNEERAIEGEIGQLNQDFERASLSLEETKRELASYEAADALITSAGIAGGIGSVSDLQRQYSAEFEDATSRRDDYRQRRDASRAEYKTVQQELAAAYADAQREFVPVFRDLAHSFLGLEVDIQLDFREAAVGLILSVEDTRRREFDQLSESQRFFVDIALRMAIAQQLANPESHSTLFIDTPEGSLDIAYEARAGSMFARFATGGSRIVMTANINTSQLLQRLASMCGPDRMRLLRMTDWARLSDVQLAEEALFDQAFAAIEAALVGGGTSSNE